MPIVFNTHTHTHKHVHTYICPHLTGHRREARYIVKVIFLKEVQTLHLNILLNKYISGDLQNHE